jgi:hypothetical protein
VITDHHDGTATFTWPTRPEHAGTTVLRVAAFDEGGGEVFHDVEINVVGSERPTASPTPLATVSPAPCTGDCNSDGQVTVDELLVSTSIALGRTAFADCPAACSTPPTVTIDCLTRAVGNAIGGCP